MEKYKPSILTRVLNLLFGDKDSMPMENRIYNAAALLAFAAGVVGLIWNSSMGLPWQINVVIICYLSIYVVLYYFARIKRRYSTFAYLFTALSGLSLLWITSDGFNGSTPMLYIISIAAFVSLSKKKYHGVALFITFANILILFLLEYFYEDIIISYPSEEVRNSDILFGFGATFLTMFALISFFKRNYDRENRKLIEQKKVLDETIAVKDKFFSIIAHDLRGPFNTILGYSEMMSSETENMSQKDMRQYASMTHSSAGNAFGLLENLLDWTRMYQGEFPFNPEILRAGVFIEKALKTSEGMRKKKDVSLNLLIEEGLTVYGDRNMLQVILRNLISNAVKFTPIGGEILVKAESLNACLAQISIGDNGIGMDDRTLNNLFKNRTVDVRKGTDGEPSSGLGLLLCKEFVVKQGGEISVSSEVGKGSVFRFTLPISKINKLSSN